MAESLAFYDTRALRRRLRKSRAMPQIAPAATRYAAVDPPSGIALQAVQRRGVDWVNATRGASDTTVPSATNDRPIFLNIKALSLRSGRVSGD